MALRPPLHWNILASRDFRRPALDRDPFARPPTPYLPPAHYCLAHCGPPGLEALRGEGQQESSGNGKFSTNLCGMPERIRVAEKCLDLPLHTGDFSRKEER